MVRINYVTPYFWLLSKINRSNYLVLARYLSFTSPFFHPLLAHPLSSAVLIQDQGAFQAGKYFGTSSTQHILPHKAIPSLNSHHIAQGFLHLGLLQGWRPHGISGPVLDCHSKTRFSASNGNLPCFTYAHCLSSSCHAPPKKASGISSVASLQALVATRSSGAASLPG